MRTATAHILLTLFLAGCTFGGLGGSELKKLGGLLEHYRHHTVEHQQANLSLFRFLLEHFSADAIPESEHGSLPFHGTTPDGAQTFAVPVGLVPCLPLPVEHRPHLPLTWPRWHSLPTSGVFQPPRA